MAATPHRHDVAILGTGMSGTILGAILASQGADVVMLDSQPHPRFAVGESTIPHTSLLLSILAERYGVPEIDYLAYPDRIARRICTRRSRTWRSTRGASRSRPRRDGRSGRATSWTARGTGACSPVSTGCARSRIRS